KTEEIARFVKNESAHKTETEVTRFTLHSELVGNKDQGGLLSQTHFEVASQVILVRESERVSQCVGGDAVDAVVNRKLVNAFDDLVLDDQVRITSEMQWIIDFRALSIACCDQAGHGNSNIERECELSGPGGAG